ncbi:MAG: amidohydrolase family protein [Chloroflexi bacterium]|nr:amidohydrolase family protein [Chloroflexota bacterium]
MLLADFRPRAVLSTRATRVPRARFPVVDAHNHLAEPFGGGWDKRPLAALLDELDQAGVTGYVDLDGGWSTDILHAHLDHFKQGAPQRFQIFGGVDWAQWPAHGNRFGEWAAAQLRLQAARGAQGLKIWKPLGLHVRDQLGALVSPDDARLDALWAAAGELRLPVMVHVADPVAFFEPLDATNERWEELHAHPDWQFPAPPFPPFLNIVNALARVVERHPQTTFIGAHVGCYAENLGWVAALLARCPNFYIDFSARIGELGRQPYSARRFFVKYADRILFGTDQGPDVQGYQLYYRFLETDDEYFSYGTGEVPGQGRWQVHGLHLPDDVLEKIYNGNARRVLGLG